MRTWILLGAALAVVRPLAAQDTAIVIHPESAGLHFTPPELPGAVVDEAVRFYNALTTTRIAGRVRLPAGNTWRGNVAVRNGPALVGGRIEGSLLVLNGSAVLDSTARITGELFVIGGTIAGSRGAVAGAVRAYDQPLPYRLVGDTLIHAPDLFRRLSLSARYTFGRGESRSSLTLATGGTFNRVEGLPIVAGPSADLALRGGDLRLRASAAGIFRTARSLTDECCDLGYNVLAELRVSERRPVTVVLRGFDLVTPVEDWGLHANEVGWEAFLVRRDYRDYYRNNGVAARLAWQIEEPLTVGLEVRREYQSDLSARNPWTLSRSDLSWRPNPPIDNGHFTTWTPSVTLDTRNSHNDPTSGWYLRAWVDASHSNNVTPQPGVPAAVRAAIPLTDYDFTRAFFDFRRYNRLSAQGRFNLRFVLGGWLGGDPLPLQKRVDIGGPEPLPGYEFRQSACNRAITDPAFAGATPAACDRVVALQTEYRGHLTLGGRYNPETGESEGPGVVTRFLRGPDFVVFGDAGQAWLVGSGPGQVPSSRLPGFGSWIADLGLGVDWSGFGVYVAKAVTVGLPLRVTLRLAHRF